MRILVVFLFLLYTTCVSAKVFSIVTILSSELPYFQTFDSWDNCYVDGACYERSCENLRGGFYNPFFQDFPDPEIRNWWVIDRQTPSNWDYEDEDTVSCRNVKTGPCYDHTQGEGGKGKFLYAESTACYGVQFQLISPTIEYNNTAHVSFYYYMHGDDMDDSKLVFEYTTDNGTNWEQLETIKGEQQSSATKAWKKYEKELPLTFTGEPQYVTFRWTATTDSGGNTWKDDIAIDDVLIWQDGNNMTDPPVWIDPNCTASDTCIPPSTSSTGTAVVSGSSGGGGLSDGDIAGIVIGTVGGAIALCCCLIILIIIVLLIISPKKPPEQQDAGL